MPHAERVQKSGLSRT